LFSRKKEVEKNKKRTRKKIKKRTRRKIIKRKKPLKRKSLVSGFIVLILSRSLVWTLTRLES